MSEHPLPKRVRAITRDEALALVRGNTEKPGGTDPILHISEQRPLYYADLPLDAFVDNSAGARYDGTVDPLRLWDYAARGTDPFPPIIAGTRFASSKLNVIDGGHRISAARARGDKTIATIFKVPEGHPLFPVATPIVEEEPPVESTTQAPS